MAEILANVTQIINNSPQVTSLVGGHQAAAEDAGRLARMAESQRQELELKSKVLALENSTLIGESDPDGRLRRESQRAQRRARRAARQRASSLRPTEERRGRDSEASAPFDTKPIIDVCV